MAGHDRQLYSLGCVLYECITGRRVFAHTTTTAYLIAHCTEPPDPPERDGLTVSGPLVDLVMRLLEKSPQDRPAGAEALQRELQELGDEPLVGGAATASAGRPMFERGGTTSKRMTAVAARAPTARPAVAATGIARDERPRKRSAWPIVVGLGAVAAVAVAVRVLLPRGGETADAAAPVVPVAPVAAARPAPEAKPVEVAAVTKPAREPVAAAPAPAPKPVEAAPAPRPAEVLAPVVVAPVAPAPKRLRLEHAEWGECDAGWGGARHDAARGDVDRRCAADAEVRGTWAQAADVGAGRG